MASNLYVNRVDYGSTTLIDISDTTATAGDVASGKTFYLASGQQATGTASGGGGLPSGYTEIPFVEANGNQWVDTSYTPTANTSVECAYQFTSSRTLEYLIASNNLAYYVVSNLQVYTGTDYPFTTPFNNDWKKLTITPTSATLVGTSSETMTITSQASSVPMVVFAGSDHYFKAKARLSYLKIWDGATLVRDLVPCTNSSNVAGFYDLVGSTFYSSGSGTALIAGKWEDLTGGGGITPTGTINITTNGTVDVTNYASADVNVKTYTLLATKSFTVNTTSTTATSVGTVACGSTAWTSSKILYVKIRDNAGARVGYCIGSDNYIYNRQPANSSTTTLQYAARITHSLRTGNEFYTYPSGTNTGYGVYASTIASDGTLTIYARYNNTYCGTINGTFTVEAYLIDYPVPNGNPYVL